MLFLLYLLSFTLHYVSPFVVNYEKLAQANIEAPCVQIEFPVNGTTDKHCLETLQTIEDRVINQLHDNDIRECYLTIDTKQNNMMAMLRQTMTMVGYPSTVIVAMFQDNTSEENILMMRSFCIERKDGLFECESETTKEPIETFVNMSQSIGHESYYSNKLKVYTKIAEKESNNITPLSNENCTRVDVPEGETENYIMKMKALDAFGQRAVFGTKLNNECILKYDAENWDVLTSSFYMQSDRAAIGFVFYSSVYGHVVIVTVVCAEKDGENEKKNNNANCKVKEESMKKKKSRKLVNLQLEDMLISYRSN